MSKFHILLYVLASLLVGVLGCSYVDLPAVIAGYSCDWVVGGIAFVVLSAIGISSGR